MLTETNPYFCSRGNGHSHALHKFTFGTEYHLQTWHIKTFLDTELERKANPDLHCVENNLCLIGQGHENDLFGPLCEDIEQNLTLFEYNIH